jgi:hypothetical protein
VIGIINADLAGEDRTNKLLADPSGVLGLLSKAGASNDLTATDEAYRKGLDEYFRGRYSDAMRTFDEVIAAQPTNLSAQSYRRQASERLAIEGDADSGTSFWPLLVAGFAILLVIVLIIIVLALVRRLRTSEQALVRYGPYQPPALPAAPVPISGVPASGPPSPGPAMLPTAADSWRAPVAPGGADYSMFSTPPRALPATTQPPVAAGPPMDQTTWPDDTTAAWPAVTVWRSPQADEPVPPPAPAPNTTGFPPPIQRQPQDPPDGRPAMPPG